MTIYARNRIGSRVRPKLRAAPARRAVSELANLIACCADKLAASFPETAILLEIARLDLVARLNGISDEEMQQVTLARRVDAAE